MDEIWIDGERLKTIGEVHDLLAAALSFPAWYGRNPDALFDCLTEPHRPVRMHVVHEDQLARRLGDSWQPIRAALEAAAEETPRVALVFDEA